MHLSRRSFLSSTAALAAGALLPAGVCAARVRAASPAERRYGGFAMGLQSYTLREMALPVMLDTVASLGLRHVELIPEMRILWFFSLAEHGFAVTEDPAAIARVRAAVRSRSLEISAHGVSYLGDEAEAQRLLAFARAARIPVLTIDPDPELLPQLDKMLVAYPELRLAIHNHGPGFRWSTIRDVEEGLEGRHPRLGACVDTGHFIRSGEDPVEALRRLGPRVHAVHLKDFDEESFFADGTILGQGRLDLDATFRALREIGFPRHAPLSLEYEENPDDPLPDIEASLDAASEAAERTTRP